MTTPAGREDFAAVERLCGRDVRTWVPADTVDGRGVELQLEGGRRLVVDGAALKMLAAMVWRADR